MARTSALIAPVHTVLYRVSCSYETIPNAAKHYAMHQNMSSGSNGVDWVHSLRKIPTWLHGTNFCINCTSSTCFASSLTKLRIDPKCTQTVCNALKHEFGVQWGWLGAFVAKNPDMTSWHKHLINYTSSHHFALSLLPKQNNPKCTQKLRNAIKDEFRVQWGGLGAFVVKTSDATLWHEFLH